MSRLANGPCRGVSGTILALMTILECRQAMDVAVSRRRFTVDNYRRMGEAGILSPTDRVELIDGEIVSMTPIGPRHGASVDRRNRALVTAVGSSAIVRGQGSVRLDLFRRAGAGHRPASTAR
jgi:hypothetical protein